MTGRTCPLCDLPIISGEATVDHGMGPEHVACCEEDQAEEVARAEADAGQTGGKEHDRG